MLKQQIKEYNLAWLNTHKKYKAINEIKKGNHIPYPEPLQKILVKVLCKDWGLTDNKNKEIDFIVNVHPEILVEMKSTTKYDGAVSLTKIQAESSSQLIWFFANAEKDVFVVKKIEITEELRPYLKERFYDKTSNSLSKFFKDYSKTVITKTFSIKNLESVSE